MREIKFRAWDKQNKNMEEVDLLGSNVLHIKNSEWENIEDFEVMQYTGLKDKNGVEVYEGDILKLFYGKENTPLTTTKVYFNEEGYWDSKNLSEQHPFRACYGGFSKCEVIGNIHENPELLKEGE
ncbi:YopX family protein [Clostridium tyrobutyricum]|uniref:YopX family protein n=1 Tax=Clostridium tyrobutyricum TaxID=1519 RepID=UPI0039F6E028